MNYAIKESKGKFWIVPLLSAEGIAGDTNLLDPAYLQRREDELDLRRLGPYTTREQAEAALCARA